MAFFRMRQSGESPAAVQQTSSQSVEDMRRRAKHRLIGAVLLVLAGVVGFPLLFDTQPRPVPVDVQISIPDKHKVPPLAMADGAPSATVTPAPDDGRPVGKFGDKPGSKIVDNSADKPVDKVIEPTDRANSTSPSAPPKSENTKLAAAAVPAVGRVSANASLDAKEQIVGDEKATAEKAAAARPKAEAKPDPKPEPKPEAKSSPKPDAKPEAKPDPKPEPKSEPKPDHKSPPKAKSDAKAHDAEADRARQVLSGKDAAKPDPKSPAKDAAHDQAAAGDGGRYVIQIGAFAESAKAQEVRRKLERAGLKTYTNIAHTPEGERIRVRLGPFSSRAEADKAAVKVKALALPAAVLTL